MCEALGGFGLGLARDVAQGGGRNHLVHEEAVCFVCKPFLDISESCDRWTLRPVIVAIRDNGDDIRALLYSYQTTITGWGVPPNSYVKSFIRLGSVNRVVQDFGGRELWSWNGRPAGLTMTTTHVVQQ